MQTYRDLNFDLFPFHLVEIGCFTLRRRLLSHRSKQAKVVWIVVRRLVLDARRILAAILDHQRRKQRMAAEDSDSSEGREESYEDICNSVERYMQLCGRLFLVIVIFASIVHLQSAQYEHFPPPDANGRRQFLVDTKAVQNYRDLDFSQLPLDFVENENETAVS